MDSLGNRHDRYFFVSDVIAIGYWGGVFSFWLSIKIITKIKCILDVLKAFLLIILFSLSNIVEFSIQQMVKYIKTKKNYPKISNKNEIVLVIAQYFIISDATHEWFEKCLNSIMKKFVITKIKII